MVVVVALFLVLLLACHWFLLVLGVSCVLVEKLSTVYTACVCV